VGPIEQVAISRGEIEPVLSVTLPKPALDDISPDGSAFLVESYKGGETPVRPTYSVAILRGSHRYLAETEGSAWSSDGKSITYSTPNSDINIMQSNWTSAHKLASTGDVPDSLSWSPNGRTIRFSETTTHSGKCRRAAPIFTSCLQAGTLRTTNVAGHGLPAENILFSMPDPNPSYGHLMSGAARFGVPRKNRFN
jgi:hypothetical protein